MARRLAVSRRRSAGLQMRRNTRFRLALACHSRRPRDSSTHSKERGRRIAGVHSRCSRATGIRLHLGVVLLVALPALQRPQVVRPCECLEGDAFTVAGKDGNSKVTKHRSQTARFSEALRIGQVGVENVHFSGQPLRPNRALGASARRYGRAPTFRSAAIAEPETARLRWAPHGTVRPADTKVRADPLQTFDDRIGNKSRLLRGEVVIADFRDLLRDDAPAQCDRQKQGAGYRAMSWAPHTFLQPRETAAAQ